MLLDCDGSTNILRIYLYVVFYILLSVALFILYDCCYWGWPVRLIMALGQQGRGQGVIVGIMATLACIIQQLPTSHTLHTGWYSDQLHSLLFCYRHVCSNIILFKSSVSFISLVFSVVGKKVDQNKWKIEGRVNKFHNKLKQFEEGKVNFYFFVFICGWYFSCG